MREESERGKKEREIRRNGKKQKKGEKEWKDFNNGRENVRKKEKERWNKGEDT